MSTDPTLSVDLERVRRNWGWFMALGACLILIGAAALARPFLVGLIAVEVLGVLLIMAGVAHVIFAFRSWGMEGAFLSFLTGVLEAVIGIVILKHTLNALVGLTLLITVSLLVGGVFRIAAAISLKLPGRGVLIFSGLVSTLLGIMLLAEYPEPAEWLIGTFVGIDLLFHGISWIMLAVAVKKGIPAKA